MICPNTPTRSVNEVVDRLRSHFGLVWVRQVLPVALSTSQNIVKCSRRQVEPTAQSDSTWNVHTLSGRSCRLGRCWRFLPSRPGGNLGILQVEQSRGEILRRRFEDSTDDDHGRNSFAGERTWSLKCDPRRLLRSNTGPCEGPTENMCDGSRCAWVHILSQVRWVERSISEEAKPSAARTLSASVIDHLSSPYSQGQGPIDETRSLDCRRSKFVGSRQRHTSGSLLLRSGQRTMLSLRCVCPVRQLLGSQTLLRNPL